jgi:hypothetical protein
MVMNMQEEYDKCFEGKSLRGACGEMTACRKNYSATLHGLPNEMNE